MEKSKRKKKIYYRFFMNVAFACTFLCLIWNLICQSANALSNHLHHIEWMVDFLSIYSSHIRNEQDYYRESDSRHIYVCLFSHFICLFLYLRIFLILLKLIIIWSIIHTSIQCMRIRTYTHIIYEQNFIRTYIRTYIRIYIYR